MVLCPLLVEAFNKAKTSDFFKPFCFVELFVAHFTFNIQYLNALTNVLVVTQHLLGITNKDQKIPLLLNWMYSAELTAYIYIYLSSYTCVEYTYIRFIEIIISCFCCFLYFSCSFSHFLNFKSFKRFVVEQIYFYSTDN